MREALNALLEFTESLWWLIAKSVLPHDFHLFSSQILKKTQQKRVQSGYVSAKIYTYINKDPVGLAASSDLQFNM